MLKRAHLRQFLAIVETGGITAAARRLNLSQPTLSAGLAELERLVGAPLVTRDRKQIRLTAAGTRLLAHARTIEREFRLAETPAQDLAPLAAPLRLGVLASLPGLALAPLAQALHGCGRWSWSKAAMPTCAAGWAKGSSTRSSRCFTAHRMMAPWWRKAMPCCCPRIIRWRAGPC
jgi:molybdenum-dependent DNA-binding transcriptional regulator ModE